MAPLKIEDFSTTAVITLLACWQMANFAKAVRAYRAKPKTAPPAEGDKAPAADAAPATTADPNGPRMARAQQNCVEFYGLFLGALWVASLFGHQYPAAILGAMFLYGRQNYFDGYVKDDKQRQSGYSLTMLALQGLFVVALIGLANTIAIQYLDYDVMGRYLMKKNIVQN